MGKITKAVVGAALAGIMLMGGAGAASASSGQYVPFEDGVIKANGNYVVTASTPKADVRFVAYCAGSEAKVAAYATKTGHTNRPIELTLTASHSGFKTQLDTKVLAKPLGSIETVRIGSGKTVRPLGTATVTLQQVNGDGTAAGDVTTITFQRPHLNCASIGGATDKDL